MDYLLRNIDPDLWNRAKVFCAKHPRLTLRMLLLSLLGGCFPEGEEAGEDTDEQDQY